MSHSDLAHLSLRWLGKAWDHATSAERAVLTQMLRRERTARAPTEVHDEDERTFGQRVADDVARFGGSWGFIGLFFGFLVVWVVGNTWLLFTRPWDPYPFIFLNLLLSMLAALQAPVIMMSQNRQAARDRAAAEHDYEVNLKAELEVMALHDKLDQLRTEQLAAIIEAQGRQIELLQRLVEESGARRNPLDDA